MVSPWVANNENSLSNVRVTKSKIKFPGWVWTGFQVEFKTLLPLYKMYWLFPDIKKNVFPWPSQPHSDCHPSARNKFCHWPCAMKPLTVKLWKSIDSKMLHGFTLGCQKLRQMCDKVKNKIPWVWTDFEVELKIYSLDAKFANVFLTLENWKKEFFPWPSRP